MPSPDQAGNSDPSQSKERVAIPVTVEGALVHATFSENRALPRGVTSLQLGRIGQIGDDLLTQTLQHPQLVEHGIRAFISASDGLFFPEPVVEGRVGNTPGYLGELSLPPLTINTYPNRRGGPKEFRQDRFVATAIHTHSELDFPPSPRDYRNFFLRDDNPFAETAVTVITKSRKPDGSITANKYVVFRRSNTPQWTEEEVDAKVTLWNKMITERVMAHINPSMTWDEQRAINARAQAAFLRYLVKQYDLRLFTAVNGSETAVEATA